ncbi:cytochrome P450 12 [Zea mays]|uniref:Cytochrome P450 12 n=1 Tax=Zea mays TaxID=4577 RepID=A0A1D6ER34_MAIZE|nr:cytochrome P450 12 [Zea mays]
MEPATWAVFLGIALCAAAALFLSRGRRPVYNPPPGPKPWPIIGNLNLMGELPHRSMNELSKRYGPLMQLRFGSLPVLVGASVEMAKLFLKTNDAAFSDRPRFAIGKYTAYDFSDLLWAPSGPYLRQARRICATELFSATRLESFEHIRDEEVRVMLRQLRQAAGRTVRLRDYLQMLALGVISRIVLGNKYVMEEVADGEGDSAPAITPAEFREMVDEFFALHGAFNIGDYIPWLDWLDLQGYVARMKRMKARFGRFLERVLDVHNERRLREGGNFVAKDMLDVLLQLADDTSLEVQLSRDNDLIIAGTDSNANTLEWAVSELLKNPKILAKAMEELNHVIGPDRLVTESDLPRLPYIEAVLKETMRVHPAAPMLAPHVAREDTSVDGYDVLAGTVLFINVWAIGRDPGLWDAPEEFRPERFVESKIDVRGHDFQLLPFGSGRRMCPGINLALKVMALSLANLLHGFEWRLPDGVTAEELSMDEAFKLAVPRKFPLMVVAEPRLPARLYTGA